MKTKVRVKRVELLRVVEGRARKAESEFKRESEGHPAKIAAWEQNCVKVLENALAQAKRGKIPVTRYGAYELGFPSRPDKPSEGRALCNLRKTLATLKIGADETILLGQEDVDDYFGPCAV